MRLPAKKTLGVTLLMAVFLISSHVLTHAQSRDDQTSGTKQELADAVPDLAEIIPLVTKLSGRLATLENKVTGVLDVSAVERKYAEIEANLKGPADQLRRLKDSKDYRYKKLVELRQVIEKENELFEKISN